MKFSKKYLKKFLEKSSEEDLWQSLEKIPKHFVSSKEKTGIPLLYIINHTKNTLGISLYLGDVSNDIKVMFLTVELQMFEYLVQKSSFSFTKIRKNHIV